MLLPVKQAVAPAERAGTGAQFYSRSFYHPQSARRAGLGPASAPVPAYSSGPEKGHSPSAEPEPEPEPGASDSQASGLPSETLSLLGGLSQPIGPHGARYSGPGLPQADLRTMTLKSVGNSQNRQVPNLWKRPLLGVGGTEEGTTPLVSHPGDVVPCK